MHKLLSITFALIAFSFVTQAGESRYNEPYPKAASIKGLQVEMTDDALALDGPNQLLAGDPAALDEQLAQLFGRGGRCHLDVSRQSPRLSAGCAPRLERGVAP